MDDLTAFITAFIGARLDEDEATAKACADLESAVWRPVDENVRSHDGGGGDVVVALERETAEHIARHDPARALREVAAKRAVLAWYADSVDAAALFKEKLGTGTHMATAAESYLNVMRGYAAVWSDHPDYRQEWAV